MLEQAVSRDRSTSYYNIRSEQLPFENESFDIVFSSFVFLEISTKKEIEKITVQIDKNQHTLASIFVQNKNQSSQLITIRNYKTGLSHADNLFVFNKKQHPKADVIDLR